MTCLRCQTIEAAIASGNEPSLIDELYRQIDRMLDKPLMGSSGPVVPRDEHERIVAKLNASIAKRNGEIESLRKQVK